MQQGRVAGTVHMEHGGGLAAQENKWGWNQHQNPTEQPEHLGEACSEQAKDKKQSPGLELTPDGGRGRKCHDYVADTSHPQSQRGRWRDGSLPVAGLGSCYWAERRLELEIKHSHR